MSSVDFLQGILSMDVLKWATFEDIIKETVLSKAPIRGSSQGEA
jgi:hypothetical protein